MANKLITDLTHRDEVESATAKVIAKILKDYEQRILNYPFIPSAELDRLEDEVAAVLYLALLTTFRNESQKLGDQLKVQNPNLEADAQNWALEKVREVIKQFRADTEKKIEKANRKAATHAAVLALVLDPKRAVNLASTYVTQAANQAEISTTQIFDVQQSQEVEIDQTTGEILPKPKEKQQKVQLIWRTRKDEKLCKLCKPLEGTTEDVWKKQYPLGPGTVHINCRCYLEKKIL